MLKLKRARLWFIRCQYPIPKPPPEPGTVRVQAGPQSNINLPSPGGPRLRPVRQPLYENDDQPELIGTKTAGPTFFHTSGPPGSWGFYWSDGVDIFWKNHQSTATGFDTREEAEARAFELATLAPWLIGKMEVIKMKVRKLG